MHGQKVALFLLFIIIYYYDSSSHTFRYVRTFVILFSMNECVKISALQTTQRCYVETKEIIGLIAN